MRAGEFVSEIGAPGELDVSEKLQRYFTDRGYDIAGEGRDQMVFHRPGQRHVVKVIGLGDDLARRDNVADYVRFFALNQRNPHFPRVSQPRETANRKPSPPHGPRHPPAPPPPSRGPTSSRASSSPTSRAWRTSATATTRRASAGSSSSTRSGSRRGITTGIGSWPTGLPGIRIRVG